MKRLLLLTLFLSFAITVKAQVPARILFNSSFEEPVIPGGNAQVDQNTVVGWDVQVGNLVEIWRNSFQGVRAQDGAQHIELNARQVSDVYLSVCLLTGETVTLTFYHRARRGNPQGQGDARIDTLRVSSFNSIDFADNSLVTINPAVTATNSPDAGGTTWTGSGVVGTQTSNSFEARSPTQGWTQYRATLTNNGPSGACRIIFSALSFNPNNSYGNFIDNVQITGLNPLTELSSATYSDIEGTGGNQPILIVNGRVPPPPAPASSIQVTISNGTATSPADYTQTGIITVIIPPGDYDGTIATGIPIPLGIINDNDDEPNETITLDLEPGRGFENGSIRINDANCDNTPILFSTYTILDDDDLLPVTFTEWKLDDKECGKVNLEWSTSQELNSNYFEVQFSEEGKEWKSIHKATAKGTSNRTNEYSFIHYTDYKAGYYRLKQVDFDGQFILTKVLSSKQDCDKESNYFKFYPNPKSSNQDLTLEFYSISSTLDYTIIDALGREVRSNSVSTTTNQFIKQNISENLTQGLYLIKFWQNGQEVYQTKLIVR